MPITKDRFSDVSAPAQHKQTSRKGKKTWRKNVDITEIEAGLEERNEQIIQGGFLAEKESDDLFDIDVKGNSAAKFSVPTRLRGLKADDIIGARSAVPAIDSRKRPASKVSAGLIAPKNLRSDWVSHKELARLKRVADGEHAPVGVTDATYDLWDASAEPITKKTKINIAPEENFITQIPKAKVPNTMREAPASLAANGKAIPAVKKPTGGFSYNPSFNEYAGRLKVEGAKALAAEQKRLAEIEKDRLMAEAAARSAAEAEAAEANLELSEWEEDSAWEGFESGAEDGTLKTAKRPQRKTQVQKNRIERRKEAERKAVYERMIKHKQEQLNSLKKIKKEVAAHEEELAQRAAKVAKASDTSASEGDDTELRRKVTLPVEQDLELVLPDELQDSLRALKPEGNLLKDRYRSLLVRGRVDARKRIPFKKQTKGKFTEKWTYKDFRI